MNCDKWIASYHRIYATRQSSRYMFYILFFNTVIVSLSLSSLRRSYTITSSPLIIQHITFLLTIYEVSSQLTATIV